MSCVFFFARVSRALLCLAVVERARERIRMFHWRLIDWRWVLRLAVVVLLVAVLPVLMGIWLDRQFHSSPVITLSMMLLGFNLGIIAIARSVAEMYTRVENNSQRVGGDQ